MGVRAVLIVIQRVFYFLEYLWDSLMFRILGVDDMDEEPVRGKVAIVTGSNTGIGKQVAKDLAEKGATVILACRNLQLGQEAMNDIKSDNQYARVELMHLDLADLLSIRKFAVEFKSKYPQLHLLINNAGLASYKQKLQKTAQDFERHMGVNHLAHFLLTNLLMDELKAGAPSRVVTVSSTCLLTSYLKLDDLMMETFKNPTVFTGMSTLPYSNSKLANALFTKELARRLEGTGVSAYCLCPGMVKTEVFRDVHDLRWMHELVVKFGVALGGIPIAKSSQSILYCALSRKCEHESGKFYRFGSIFRRANRMLKVRDAEELWRISERLVQL